MEELPIELIRLFLHGSSTPWSRLSLIASEYDGFWVDKIEDRKEIKLKFVPDNPKKLYKDIQEFHKIQTIN